MRFGSARYSVPARLVGEQVRVSVAGDHVLIDHDDVRVAEHPLIAPGEVSILDDHYGWPHPAAPCGPPPHPHGEGVCGVGAAS